MQICAAREEAVPIAWEAILYGERENQVFFDAMAQPGRILEIEQPVIAPGPINMASATICAALLALELPLWTDLHWQSKSSHWLQYDCMCSIVSEPCMAKYAVVTAPLSMPALDQFRIGDRETTDPATTLIIQVIDFEPVFEDSFAHHRGSASNPYFPVGLPDNFWGQRLSINRTNPRGIDIIFTRGRQMMFLPGNSRITI